jgi:hypothetical protein
MTETRWRSLAVALAVILAVILGFAAALVLTSGGPGPTATPGATASSGPGPSGTGSSAPSGGPSLSPSAPPPGSAAPSAAPSASLGTGIVFTGLRLDAATDKTGHTRTFTFATRPGTVTAKLTVVGSGGRIRICLKPPGGAALCRDLTSGTLTGKASAISTWTVTLVGVADATPTVNLELGFTAAKPTVTLTGGRFNGTQIPGYGGVVFELTARAAGDLHVKAAWSGSFPYGFFVEALPAGGHGFEPQGPAPGLDVTNRVVAATTYRVTLANASAGFGSTDLTVAVSWP